MDNAHNHNGTMPDEAFIVAAFNAVNNLKWKIKHITRQGIIAAPAEGQDIRIIKTEEGINIAAKGGDSDTARHNVETLKTAFEYTVTHLDPHTIHNHYYALSQRFEKDSALTDGKQSESFLQFFVPTRNYLFTPFIIYANVLIFILMVIKGMDFFKPDGEIMVAWGANFKPYTLNGEWWRLVTSCFLHFGILHLAVNMYALLYIGVMLEPLIGKWRYITAYLLTGVASSALSLYWNNFGASAGASGAVFGMYGMFIAMLLSGIVNKQFQKELLASMAGFVIINLSFGFAASGIDNAGHIGGLLSGILIGFVMVPGLKKPKNISLKLAGYIGALIIGLGSGWFAYNYATDHIAEYNKLRNELSQNEKLAVNQQQAMINSTDYNKIANAIRTKILPYWKKNKEINAKIASLDLPESISNEQNLIVKYTDLRINYYTLLLKGIDEKSKAYDNDLLQINNETQSIINEVNALRNKSEVKP
ncbi:rhomboid family intramembrane serine protease [Flavobacterium akiainvivens]|uniref:rhomboid family intramembrane serine protease n=1 Tax=Flavobacterium akiainvivens TaxID=1202724 RepID=UPI0006C8A078|nr:rhomboid family intramembrane serine protease [Flavobacterium akiainvivens]SFQ76619.1 rhomboid protease GluP [Flavobacterium akiainvivens]